MSLCLQQPVPPVPDDTARIARAAFPRGNPYLLLRDRLGPVFDDAGFADLYPQRGQPAYTPWRLALGIEPATGFTLQAGPGGRQRLVFGARP